MQYNFMIYLMIIFNVFMPKPAKSQSFNCILLLNIITKNILESDGKILLYHVYRVVFIW